VNFEITIELLEIVFPLAISFFTLQQIAFLIDTYEGLIKKQKLIDYFIFVTFFPQLIIGPIVHHKEMMPQFNGIRNKVKNYKNIAMGLFIFSIGLFKKVVIADTFSEWATAGFDSSATLSLFEAWATSLSYTFQIYFDFSGYTDMAIGVALLFNVRLPINFNSPYKAVSVIDFWQRWHITLTRFITTYLYTPIVRSFKRITFEKAMLATFVAMFIAGFWHGADLSFIMFYTMHAFALVINHYFRKFKIKLNKVLSWIITFNFVNISFIVFRAENFEDLTKVIKGMFGFNDIILPLYFENSMVFLLSFGVKFGGVTSNMNVSSSMYGWIIAFLFVVVFFKNSLEWSTLHLRKNFSFVFIGFLMFFSLLKLSGYSEFIYFRF